MEQNAVTYRDILKNRDYRRLILSGTIDRFGDSVDALAFTWLVYQITHNATWSAIVFGLNMLPNVLVQPFAGALVERMDKKLVIVATHLLRAAVISAFAVLYRLELVTAPVMAAATLLITTIESFNLPASSAFTARVIRKEHVTRGMSLSKILTGAASLVGTGIAGVLIATWGVLPAMVIDVATFFLAAALILGVAPVEEAPREAEGGAPIREARFSDLFRDGIRYVVRTPVVRNFCLLCVALNFMLVPINALQAPIAEEIFHMGGELLSFVGVFSSIGGIAGAALLPVLSKRLSPLSMTCLGIGALGAGLAGISLGGLVSGNAAASYALASACFFLMVAAASLMGGVIGIQFMKSVDRDYMARASAVFGAVSTAAMPVGSFLVSALVSRVDTGRLLLFSAVFALGILLVTALTRPVLERGEGLPDAA